MGYTVIQDERGGVRALRYDEEWRDCGLILALAQEVEALRAEVDGLLDRVDFPAHGNPYRHGCDPAQQQEDQDTQP